MKQQRLLWLLLLIQNMADQMYIIRNMKIIYCIILYIQDEYSRSLGNNCTLTKRIYLYIYIKNVTLIDVNAYEILATKSFKKNHKE